MALKPRVRPAATPSAEETPKTEVTSRERKPPVQVAEEVDETEVENDAADTGVDASDAGDTEPNDVDAGGEAESQTPVEGATVRRQRASTPAAAPTSTDPKGSPKERLVEIRRELKALNSEELGARKALDAEYGARRKALRSEYDLLTRQETAVLFGDETE